ncbi:MAG: toll/interleukin-1 receptor domain-containing protein [Actinomycetota bacterium]
MPHPTRIQRADEHPDRIVVVVEKRLPIVVASTVSVMKPASRLRLIKKLAPILGDMECGELDMTLRQFGFSWTDQWEGTKFDYALNFLETGSDESLEQLRDYLLGEEGVAKPASLAEAKFWVEGRFHLFLTHVSPKKKFVGDVKEELFKFGVDGFVAHKDIEPTKEWVNEIDLALATCDALAAFLTPGFKKSDWTDQEVGYCMARWILIIPVIMGVTPYGFISRYQGLDALDLEPTEVAVTIVAILSEHELTADRMADALVANFVNSGSYVDAQDNWKRLQRYVKSWTPERLRALEKSIDENRQVREAFDLPDKVRALVAQHSQQEEGAF